MYKILAAMFMVIFVTGCNTYQTVKHSNVTIGQRYYAAKYDYLSILKVGDMYVDNCVQVIKRNNFVTGTKPPCANVSVEINNTKNEIDNLIKVTDPIYDSGDWTKLEAYIPAFIAAADRIKHYIAD